MARKLLKSASQQLPSERRFGLLFTAVFALLGAYGWWFKAFESFLTFSFVGIGLLFGLVSIFSPKILAPLNKAWFYLGQFLGRIVSPIVLGIIFFGILTPVGLITRLFGRDELRLKRTKKDTYWVDRSPPGPQAESFKNQF
jgi:polyferredoxin